MAITADEALYFINHIFLPPKLPHKSDSDHAARKLLSLFATAARDYGEQLDDTARAKWLPFAQSIDLWRDVYHSGGSCEVLIEQRIKLMKPKATLLLYLDAQNAALLITRLESSYKFEAWEVAAKQEDVLAAKNALIRNYPALAVEVPVSTVVDPNFLHTFTARLSDLAEEAYAPKSMDKVLKAGAEIEETRQSNNPCLVTEWFFTALASYGSPVSTEALQKRTRDEVNWDKALLPWRRSPIWSSVKVGLQLAIHNSSLADPGHRHYKQFMVFFLSSIAHRLLSESPPMSYLQVMRAKIARRASKLEDDVPAFVSASYMSTIERISRVMEHKWEQARISADKHLPLIHVEKCDPQIELRSIGPFLRDLHSQATDKSTRFQRTPGPNYSAAFRLPANELPDARVFDFELDARGFDPESVRARKEVLISFQTWVADNLQAWLRRTHATIDVCTQLKDLIEHFWKAAHSCFSPYAELMSLVLLTIFELWIALDVLVIRLCPLLKDYSPGIPIRIFTPLLLRKHSDMARLRAIEVYLYYRNEDSVHSSIFEPLNTNSLTVRLYDQSEDLQELMEELEDDAEEEKEQLRAEFYRLSAESERVITRWRDEECDKKWIKDGVRAGVLVHIKENCRRCKAIGWVRAVSLERYEEPLPEDPAMRKALVYELDPDAEVVVYRDCLWFVLKDILGIDTPEFETELYSLKDVDAISSIAPSPSRIGLASTTKPHGITHRHRICITTSVDTLFQPHASRWEMVAFAPSHTANPSQEGQDSIRSCKGHISALWLQDSCLSLSRFVHAQLGKTPYAKLIETVHSARTSQNSVIARQSICPIDIHTSEWIAFGSTRSGTHLQLINLLRSLSDRELDFSSSSTVIVVEQVLHEAGGQSGRPNEVLRAGDVDFQKPSYTNQILELISAIIQSIEGNWKETSLMWVLLTVAQRTLSLSKGHTSRTVPKCLNLIREIRETCLDWTKRLMVLHMAQRADGSTISSSAETRRRILDTALLIRAT